MSAELKPYSRDLDLLLETVGCERVCKSIFVSHKTKRLPFNIDDIHYVLTLDNGSVPRILRESMSAVDKKIVTSEWFVQCLLNNSLLEVETSPSFYYQHKHKSDSNDVVQ